MAKKEKITDIDLLKMNDHDREEAIKKREIAEENTQQRIDKWNAENIDRIAKEKIDRSREKILRVRQMLKDNAPIIFNIFARRKMDTDIKQGGPVTHQSESSSAIQDSNPPDDGNNLVTA